MVRADSAIESVKRYASDIVRADLTDLNCVAEAVAQQDAVVNLAAITKSFETKKLFEVNQQGAKNVDDACARQCTPPTLIQVSSFAAAGPTSNKVPRKESDPPRPVSNYGK